MVGGRLPTADLTYVPCYAIAHVFVGAATLGRFSDAAPPRRLGRYSKLLVNLGSSDAALTLQLLIFVWSRQAPDDLNENDQQGRGVATCVDGGVQALNVERTPSKLPSNQRLVGRNDSGEGKKEVEPHRCVAEEPYGALHETLVPRAVMFDRVVKGEERDEPADDQTERPCFEPAVGCGWHCI